LAPTRQPAPQIVCSQSRRTYGGYTDTPRESIAKDVTTGLVKRAKRSPPRLRRWSSTDFVPAMMSGVVVDPNGCSSSSARPVVTRGAPVSRLEATSASPAPGRRRWFRLARRCANGRLRRPPAPERGRSRVRARWRRRVAGIRGHRRSGGRSDGFHPVAAACRSARERQWLRILPQPLRPRPLGAAVSRGPINGCTRGYTVLESHGDGLRGIGEVSCATGPSGGVRRMTRKRQRRARIPASHHQR
jgi:hypothetical protein